jgi:hypothetical protein
MEKALRRERTPAGSRTRAPNGSSVTKLTVPARRPLRVYAFDPSRGKMLGNEMLIDVRYRRLGPGPVDHSAARDRLAVVDYDVSRGKYYRPADLENPFVLIPNGISPCESDPRFHQQMVYAVASDTIEQFESALGRRIHWRRAERPFDAPRGWLPDDVLTLTLYPHAMQQANAFYSPDVHGILFGYFPATEDDPGHNIAGQTVFTCLSHDIVVHETTHAIVDGLRGHFMEQTNPDVAAFHEAFADLAALFRHFTHREVLLDTIAKTGGHLYTPALKNGELADAGEAYLAAGDPKRNPLIEVAGQFGEAIGMRTGLRSAIGKPKTMNELRDTTECHERGSVLVAAVFEAFFTVYIRRTADHFRIYRAAGGHDREDLPGPLADALCREAIRTARQFFRSCVRALDYLPPVDVTFGDFLRAVMTSEIDFDPADEDGVRDAWMQAFRRRGILPDDAQFFSEVALAWPVCPDGARVKGLPFGGPMGPSFKERKQTARALRKFVDGNRELLRLDPDAEYQIPSFHPLYRVNASGSVRWDMVVELVQTRTSSTYPVRGGTTMIVSTPGTSGSGYRDDVFLRYVIAKPLDGAAGQKRTRRQQDYLAQIGVKPHLDPGTYRVNFALIHGGA